MNDSTSNSNKNEETIDVKFKTDVDAIEPGMVLAETDVEVQVMEKLESNIDNRMSFVLGDFGDAFAPIASVEDFSTLSSLDTETNSFTSIGKRVYSESSNELFQSKNIIWILGKENLISSTETLKSNDMHVEEKIKVGSEKEFEDFTQPKNEEDSSKELAKVDAEVDIEVVSLEAKVTKYPSSPTLHNRHDDTGQNNSMNHDKEVDQLEQALADTGKK